jgi:hypothetical protein
MSHAAVESAIAACSTLSPSECRHFLDKGYVVVKGAFPRELADELREAHWQELEGKGILRGDPATWSGTPYVRTGGDPQTHIMARRGDVAAQVLLPDNPVHLLSDVAPRALGAQLDMVRGNVAPATVRELELPGTCAVNLCRPVDAQPLGAASPGWHKDGWQYRHFLDSPEQGLLLMYFFSDILPGGGGTQVALDSIKLVAEFFAQHPEGVHPDIAQGVLNPFLVEQSCEDSRFEELTGNAGDLAIIHPYMMHRTAPNPSGRARFASHPSLLLAQPMNFARDDEAYSLCELVTLKALGLERLDFRGAVLAAGGVRELVTPPPARDEAAKVVEARRVLEQKETLRARYPLLANL